MAVLKLRTLPDPVLRQKAKKIATIDGSIHRLIDDMIDTMRAVSGVGLAAPQVGVSLRVAVIEIPGEDVITLVNPEVVKREGTRTVQEACLSFPGYQGEIERAARVKVRAQDREGRRIRINGDGLLAQALEHETDHLNGTMYIDHVESDDKLFRIEREGEEQAGSEPTRSSL